MNKHAYLRAYMAGIAVPTPLLLIGLTVFAIARYGFHLALPVERMIVFPLAVVPNLWGLWNMLYLRLRAGPHLPLGLHGGILPFILAPAGILLARAFGFQNVLTPLLGVLFPIGVILYYLIWKLVVGFLNELLGIA